MRNAKFVATLAAILTPSLASAQGKPLPDAPSTAVAPPTPSGPAAPSAAPAPSGVAAPMPSTPPATPAPAPKSATPADTPSAAPSQPVSASPPSGPAPVPPAPPPKPSTDARALEGQAGRIPPATSTSALSGGLKSSNAAATETSAETELASPRSSTLSPTFAEDWWTHTRPILELHGSFRTRAELFHNFSLNRRDAPSNALWPRPSDRRYGSADQETYGPVLCTANETDKVQFDSDDPADGLFACDNNTQSGANLRLRLNPEIHISDNVRIRSQIDLLDNLVLGSSPEGLRYRATANGLEVAQRSGYNQLSFYDSTQVAPDSASNNFSDSVRVKRAWGEYSTPLGEVRFGRMPHHFGMGMLYNSGDGYDDDYQSTVDRLMVMTTFSSWDITVAGMWDFAGEGAISSIDIPGAQPYDNAGLDDINQYGLMLLKQKDPQLERLALSRSNLVINSGLYVLYRDQILANDRPISGALGGTVPGADLDNQAGTDTFARRDAYSVTPDLWLQLKYKKFRIEAEAAAIIGEIGSPSLAYNGDGGQYGDATLKLRQYGVAMELEQKLVEDRLRLGFNVGWSSGDPDVEDTTLPGSLIPGADQAQVNDNTISTFRFHPAYRVDLILNRNILQRIQGTYYVRPSVEYDFLRDTRGQRAGGGVQAIWTRASEFIQTPGHDADLGLELNASLYYQARDGALNDSPDAMGGFYAMVQAGAMFPLAGMDYQSGETEGLTGGTEITAAQILRLYLGIMF